MEGKYEVVYHPRRMPGSNDPLVVHEAGEPIPASLGVKFTNKERTEQWGAYTIIPDTLTIKAVALIVMGLLNRAVPLKESTVAEALIDLKELGDFV